MPRLHSAEGSRLQRACSSAYVYRRSPCTTAVRSPIVSAARFKKLSGLSSTRDGAGFISGLPSCRWRGCPRPEWDKQAPLAGGRDVRARDVQQPGHPVAERARPRVVALAAQIAAVDRLAEDRRLPQRERLVPAQPRDVATGALRVAGDELVAGREDPPAGGGGAGGGEERMVVGVRLRPADGEVSEVGEGVADRRHLPVEDRDEPRRH